VNGRVSTTEPARRTAGSSDPVVAADPGDHAVAGGGALLSAIVVLNAVALPVLIPRGPLNAVPADLPAVLLIMVGSAVLWQTRPPIRIPLGLSYTLVVVGGLLGTAQSIAPEQAAVALAIDLYVFAWFIVLVNCFLLDGEPLLRLAMKAWVVVALLVSVLGVIALALGYQRMPSILGYPVIDRFDRFSGTFRDPNYAGAYLVVSIFVLWASPWPSRRRTKTVLAIPLLLAAYATESNTAVFALAGGTVVAFLVGFVRSRSAPFSVSVRILAVVIVLIALAPAFFLESPATTARSVGATELFRGSLGRFDSSLSARVGRIRESLRLFGPQLVLGIGPSTTNETLLAQEAPILGEMHDDYVAALVERGVIGAIGVVMLFGVVLVTALKIPDPQELRGSGWSVSPVVGAVTAVMITGLSLETLHFRHVWFVFALVFALALRRIPMTQPRHA
jgi:O-Antigen ligase